MSAKNKKKIDYIQLRLSDDYWYTSEEEQEEEQEESKMKNKMKNKNKTRRTKKQDKNHLIQKKLLNG